jgi:hypothetical protein
MFLQYLELNIVICWHSSLINALFGDAASDEM